MHKPSCCEKCKVMAGMAQPAFYCGNIRCECHMENAFVNHNTNDTWEEEFEELLDVSLAKGHPATTFQLTDEFTIERNDTEVIKGFIRQKLQQAKEEENKRVMEIAEELVKEIGKLDGAGYMLEAAQSSIEDFLIAARLPETKE